MRRKPCRGAWLPASCLLHLLHHYVKLAVLCRRGEIQKEEESKYPRVRMHMQRRQRSSNAIRASECTERPEGFGRLDFGGQPLLYRHKPGKLGLGKSE